MTTVCAVAITRNSPEELDRTLGSLASHPWLDCIVVSDDSDQEYLVETARAAERYGAIHVTGPRRGPTPNRLNGLRRAMEAVSPTHVLFVDDDITVPTGAADRLRELIALYPDDILCPLVADGPDGGPLYHPSEVNWRGLRSHPAPDAGGYGLSDNFMVWPANVALEVHWDGTFPYGYSEAWLGYQAMRNGTNIRIVKDVILVHRMPGRHSGGLDRSMEPARVYYNFLLKQDSKGTLAALTIFLADALWTGTRRILKGRNVFGMYASLIPLLAHKCPITSSTPGR